VAPAPAAEQAQGTYTVKAGDTIAKIAKAHGMRWDTLAADNGVKSPFLIHPGKVLKVSGSAAAPAATPAPTEHVSRGGDRTAPTPPAPSVASSGKGAGAVAFMLQSLREGDSYIYGSNGPSTWDCSSLTQAAWKSQGVNLPRTSAAQASAGTATTRAALVPGDLVRYPGHIAMYIGDGQVVHAVNKDVDLKVTSLDWNGKPTGYRHIG
jgi:cell wall-associated NlpC family hydrolase